MSTEKTNPFAEIASACTELAGLRGKLRTQFERRQKAVNAATAAYDGDIRQIQERCSATRTALEQLVGDARPEFLRPRQAKTRIFAGIEVGFEKERDQTVWPEESVLVRNIETMLPAKSAETLLYRTVCVIKNAVKKLPAEIKQRLGIRTLTGADSVVIRANDDDIETLVQKALGQASDRLKLTHAA
ncbi:MAG: hypothetical protein KGL39_44475 [Patescibacteria group bacterium]|nr:hypothetical protein [Patescibacteria group bacterium]